MAREPQCNCVSGPIAEGSFMSGGVQPVFIGGIDQSRNNHVLNMDTNGNLFIGGLDYPGVALADGNALPSLTARVGAVGMEYNGSTLRLKKTNEFQTLLASAARTVTTQAPDITNDGWSFCVVYLDVTVASGTGGLQVIMSNKNQLAGNYKVMTGNPTAVTATGRFAYVYGIYAVSNLVASGNAIFQSPEPMGSIFAITCQHVDASSYTYSLGIDLLKAS